MKAKLPVLLIAFNRIDSTKRVFESIKKYAPQKLFISIDGPRNELEKVKVEQVLNFIETSVDWKCEVQKKVSTHNLGCKKGCISAIDWFFENVGMGIILEDDCVPSNAFYTFCENALIKYQNDDRVSIISGSRFCEDGQVASLSKYQMIWGWASWANRWELYKENIDSTRIAEFASKLASGYFEKLCWKDLMLRLHQGKIPSAWDFQLLFWSVLNDKYSVIPPVNMITNIGVGEGATNNSATSIVNFRKSYEIEVHKNILNNIKWEKDIDQKIGKLFFGFSPKKFIYKKIKSIL